MNGKLKVNKKELKKLKVAATISGIQFDGEPLITGDDMRFGIKYRSAQELFDFAVLSKEVSGDETFGKKEEVKK